MALVWVTVALATVAATIPAPILLLALRSAAVVAFFFPSFAIFALLWGSSALLRPFSPFFLGYTFSVTFLAPPVSSPLISHLRWLALCVLAAGLLLCWSGYGF